MAGARDVPGVSWTTVISTAAFLALLVGGGWTIFQTQFSGVAQQIRENKDTCEKNDEAIRRMIERRTSELSTELSFQRSRIIEGRKEAIGQDEFKQFGASINLQFETLRKQLAVLESTRPTTGELQAASKNALDTAARLEERVRALEQYLLGQSKIFSPQQIQPQLPIR